MVQSTLMYYLLGTTPHLFIIDMVLSTLVYYFLWGSINTHLLFVMVQSTPVIIYKAQSTLVYL
jgi:hypothetical protein